MSSAGCSARTDAAGVTAALHPPAVTQGSGANPWRTVTCGRRPDGRETRFVTIQAFASGTTAVFDSPGSRLVDPIAEAGVEHAHPPDRG